MGHHSQNCDHDRTLLLFTTSVSLDPNSLCRRLPTLPRKGSQYTIPGLFRTNPCPHPESRSQRPQQGSQHSIPGLFRTSPCPHPESRSQLSLLERLVEADSFPQHSIPDLFNRESMFRSQCPGSCYHHYRIPCLGIDPRPRRHWLLHFSKEILESHGIITLHGL
jgi:hypothetical protein